VASGTATGAGLVPAGDATTRKGAGDDVPKVVITQGTPRRGSSLTPMRAAGWGALIAGVTSFGFGLKFALDVRDINHKLDPYRRFKCPASEFGCMLDGSPAPKKLRPDEDLYVERQQGEGRRFVRYQYAAAGIGAAFLVASGVCFYLGYFSDDRPTVAVRGSGVSRLQLLPVVSAGGGGLVGHFAF
jgi:hypothetical protein